MTLHSEIFEQPAVLRRLVEGERTNLEKIVHSLRGEPFEYVYLAARGTSDNAGRYADYVFGSLNHLPVALATPSLFTRYHQVPRLAGALVVGISQSGQSPDVVEVLAEARRQGRPTLAITNRPDSPLGMSADYVIDLAAGEERAVAATKTYSASLAAISLLASLLAGEKSALQALEEIPAHVETVLQREAEISAAAGRMAAMQRCVVLGRGYHYATAFEWALKMKEMAYVLAEPYSPADFMHGPLALVEHDFPVLAVATQGEVLESMLEVMRRVRNEQHAELVVLSDNPEALQLASVAVPLPERMPEWLAPIVSIVAAQLFAYHLTAAKGLNPDLPRSIQKVTETE
ncbi:MAG TPA: SIS domain-containing protein [Anaerolineaceae bacterium]